MTLAGHPVLRDEDDLAHRAAALQGTVGGGGLRERVALDRGAEPSITDQTILAKQHVTARGRVSGIELDTISWSVWTFDEDGLITRIEIYLDRERDKALAAAARSE